MASYSKRSDIEKQFEKKLEEAGISRYDFLEIKRNVSELLDDDEKIGLILLGELEGDKLDLGLGSSLRLPRHSLFNTKRLLIITDSRLVIAREYGMPTHMSYSDIRSIDYFDKLFSGNSGTLTIGVAKDLGEKFVFKNLNKDQGRKIAAFLKGAAEIGIKIGEFLKQIMAENVSAPSSSKVITMLEELGSLKEHGLITDGEFQHAKSKLMSRS